MVGLDDERACREMRVSSRHIDGLTALNMLLLNIEPYSLITPHHKFVASCSSHTQYPKRLPMHTVMGIRPKKNSTT